MKRSATREGDFVHVPTGAYDRDLFAIVWGPTVAALSFVFDKSSDEVIVQRAVSGFRFVRVCLSVYRHHRQFICVDIACKTQYYRHWQDIRGTNVHHAGAYSSVLQ